MPQFLCVTWFTRVSEILTVARFKVVIIGSFEEIVRELMVSKL